MKTRTLLFISLFALNSFAQSDSSVIRKIFNYNLTSSKTYSNLDYLCNAIGGRLSGSIQADKAVDWAKQAMYAAGADTVYLVPCMVPHWVRGAKEQAKIISAKTKKTETLAICALGGSVATPINGITAEVIEVKSFDELDKLGAEKIKGKIIFYNVNLEPTHIHTGQAYGESVKYRYSGASKAAKYGAVASIVKSMTLSSNNSPHTGVMGYDTLYVKIPTCAVSAQGAKTIISVLQNDKAAKITIKMSCKTLPDKPSFSVVGEIKGSEFPNEYIVAGGHLDSWDNGQGAHDDGSGVVQSIETIAAFKALKIKPKRTIRAVAFMNEENGTRGANAYAAWVKKEKMKHIFAIESDAGGFTPRSIDVETNGDTLNYFLKWNKLFAPYGVNIKKGWSGTDVEPLAGNGCVTGSYEPDSQRYFDYHHTQDDTFDKINKRELELGAACMTSFIYLLSEYGGYK